MVERHSHGQRQFRRMVFLPVPAGMERVPAAQPAAVLRPPVPAGDGACSPRGFKSRSCRCRTPGEGNCSDLRGSADYSAYCGGATEHGISTANRFRPPKREQLPAKLYVALVLLDLQLLYPEIDVSRLFAHARAHFLRQPFTGYFLVGRADNGQWRWVADKIRHCDYMINATGAEPPPRR